MAAKSPITALFFWIIFTASSLVHAQTSVVLSPGKRGEWDDFKVVSPSVMKDGDIYRLWYVGCRFAGSEYACSIGEAESSDGASWKKKDSPVLVPKEAKERRNLHSVSVVKNGSTYVMFYSVSAERFAGVPYAMLYFATSSDGRTWKDEGAVLRAVHKGTNSIAHSSIFDGKIYHVWYVDAPHPKGVFNLLHVTSPDGKNWSIEGGTEIETLGLDSPGAGSFSAGILRFSDGSFLALGAQKGTKTTTLRSVDGTEWSASQQITLPVPGSETRTSVSLVGLPDGAHVWMGLRPEKGKETIGFATVKWGA